MKWGAHHTIADAFYYSEVIIKCSFFCGWWWKSESNLRGGKCFRLCRPQLTITQQHHKPYAGLAFHIVMVYSTHVCKPHSTKACHVNSKLISNVCWLAWVVCSSVSDCACYLWLEANYVDVNLLVLYNNVWAKIINGSYVLEGHPLKWGEVPCRGTWLFLQSSFWGSQTLEWGCTGMASKWLWLVPFLSHNWKDRHVCLLIKGYLEYK